MPEGSYYVLLIDPDGNVHTPNDSWEVPLENEFNAYKLFSYKNKSDCDQLASISSDQLNNQVYLALKNDRKALSEKKFRKLLKKSVFENFSERFGVSEQTQEQLGKIYLDIEEVEAKAEADSLSEVKEVYHEKKSIMEAELKGFGKEARKLLERYKKASRTQIKAFVEGINLSYTQYEEELKQIMIEYEIAVGTEGITAEDALSDYENKLRAAFEAHRSTSEENKENAVVKLVEIADEYSQIGMAFRKAEEIPAELVTEYDASEQTEDADNEAEEAPEGPLTEEGPGEVITEEE